MFLVLLTFLTSAVSEPLVTDPSRLGLVQQDKKLKLNSKSRREIIEIVKNTPHGKVIPDPSELKIDSYDTDDAYKAILGEISK